jgi:hypothetical protein
MAGVPMRHVFTLLMAISAAFLWVACNSAEMVGDGAKSLVRRPKPPGGPGTDDGSLQPDDGDKAILTKPKFALMARDLRCGLCHMRINGDIVSSGDVMSFEPDRSIPAPGSDDHIVSPFRGLTLTGEYDEKINGTWFVKGRFPQDRSKTKMKLSVSGGIKENYSGVEIPPKGFPTLDLAVAESVSKGTLEAKNIKISGVHTGNVVLDGEVGAIKLAGDVLVKGDVVIIGTYIGRGTIYATGNIYIAGNIKPTKSAFPFPTERSAAMESGRTKAENRDTDALALAAKSSIIVGNPTERTVTLTPTKTAPPVPENNVYKWFPGGQGAYIGFVNNRFGPTKATLIEAYLYAENLIAGKIGSYVINGGMMCDSFHILGTRGAFVPNTNQINYDYRFAGGLNVLQALNGAFTP